MEVLVAPHAGFCFGVEKAVEMVYEEIKTGAPIYTYGPIIHNETVVKDLEAHGVKAVEGDSLPALPASGEADTASPTVVLRSHGVSRMEEETIRQKGYRIADATCPFVKRIHDIVQKASEEGDTILIIGDPEHAEVKAVKGWAQGRVVVIRSPEESASFSAKKGEKITLVAQTTYNYKKFQEAVEILSQNDYNIHVVNTICNATEVRQTEAEEIAASVDVMIVIGGRESSNSRKLYEICKEKCAQTHFIQTLDDLHLELPKAVKLVGITAGASTPKKIIEEVQHYVRTNF